MPRRPSRSFVDLATAMNPDEHVCLCFQVSRRKIVNFLRRERPVRVSQLSECLSAGTGCGWCIPFLQCLYDQWKRGEPDPDLPVSPEEYAERRERYRTTGARDPAAAPPEDGHADGHGDGPAAG